MVKRIGWRLSRIGFFLCGVVLSSGVLSAEPGQAATYYVATMGNDSNSCTAAANISTPKRNISSGLACLAPGDTLYMRAGTYAEQYWHGIRGGTSWGAPVKVAGYPGENVTLKTSSSAFVSTGLIAFTSASQAYISLEDFVVDATNMQVGIYITIHENHHVRLKNLEVKNARGQGILGKGSYHEFINLKVHHNGLPAPCDPPHVGQCHGIYVQGTNHLIDGGEYYNNEGYGVHLFPSISNSIVRNVKAYNNPTTGILLANGSNNKAYNNIAWGNKVVGIRVWSTSGLIANNTVYSNAQFGILADGGGNTIRNNIAYGNGGGNISGSALNTYSHNLCNAVSAACALSGDPRFINAATFDFYLQSTSPAIGAGANLAPTVTDDFARTSRPQGSAYDIGAYEFKQPGLAGPTDFHFVSK